MKTELSPGNKTQENRTGVIIGGSGLIGGTISVYFRKYTPDTILLLAPNSK